jgi:hypothetical protein
MKPRMARKANSPFSTDTLLTVLGILAGVCAFVFEQWAAKGLSVLFALGLIVYVGRRHDSHPLIRYPLALIAVAVFSFVPWGPIWGDFHKSYPAATWLEFVAWPSFHWALAIVAAIALGWDILPGWRVRYRVFAFWRRTLTIEGVWLERGPALDAIRASQWAQLRAPGRTIGEILTRSLFNSPESLALHASQVKFNLFLEMTLDAFEASNPDYARTTDGKKEYLEQKLLQFLRRSLTEETLKQFGPLPSGRV